MDLREKILQEFPDAKISKENISKTGDSYLIDVFCNGQHIVIEHSAKNGYGLSASKDFGFGEGPDEIFSDIEKLLVRTSELLRIGGETEAPRLRQLRELRGVTQVELAKELGIGQAAISKLERRDDMSLNSLRRFIKGLGGQLEVIAHFPDGDFAVVGESDIEPRT